ncbi:carbohydrate ABC transporter permease [candidate division NPL-UPA2 bacterium]|nr:carbohydrate ABC transporter permease [candidate division NPL-UPA2 bacterium]
MSLKTLPIYVLLVLIFLFAVVPMVWLFLASVDPVATQATRIPEDFTLSNFREAFSGRSLRWTLNTLLISVTTATIVLIVCVLGAYPFSRLSFRGKNLILFGSVFLRIIPLSVFILPAFIVFARTGLINTHFAVILFLTILGLPFPLLLLKGFYDTIPRVFEEAAWIDGCGKVRAIFKVILPQCGPGIAVAWFMTFIFTWGEFMVPLVLLRRMELMPLSVGIFTAMGEHGFVDFGFLAAVSIVYAIPPVVAYIFIRQHLVKGMVGFVKG